MIGTSAPTASLISERKLNDNPSGSSVSIIARSKRTFNARSIAVPIEFVGTTINPFIFITSLINSRTRAESSMCKTVTISNIARHSFFFKKINKIYHRTCDLSRVTLPYMHGKTIYHHSDLLCQRLATHRSCLHDAGGGCFGAL